MEMLLGRAEEVPRSAALRFPELAATAIRRGGFPPRVAGWCLGQPSVAAVTLWRTIWLGADTTASVELLLHELRHVQQFEASWAFPFQYVWESVRRGYWNNRFEVDARNYAARRLGDRGPTPPE